MSINKGFKKMIAKAIAMALALLFLCCNARQPPVEKVSSSEGVDRPTPQTVRSPIRDIDFGNVRYPNFPNYDEGPWRITQEPGEVAPTFVDYGDVTGDGNEEALVVFTLSTHGTAIPYYVYIFTLADGRLKSIWDFEAGDRGDGGVRRIYAEAGRLVVELYSEDKVVGRLFEKEASTSKPMKFTRAKYQFRGNKFHMINKPEIEPNPSQESDVLMTPYVAPMK